MIYGIQEVEVDLFRTSFVHPPDQEASAGRRPPACSRQGRPYDGRQSDPADAEHRQRTARFRAQHVQHRASTSLDAAAQWRELLEGCIAVDLDQTALINQSMASERGLAKEVGVERRAVLLNRVAAVGADATK